MSGTLESQQDPPVFEKSRGSLSAAGGPPLCGGGAGCGHFDFWRPAGGECDGGGRAVTDTAGEYGGDHRGRETASVLRGAAAGERDRALWSECEHQHQILVRRGLTYSLPVTVDVAQAEPVAFNGGQPDYAGIIYAYPRDGAHPTGNGQYASAWGDKISLSSRVWGE